MKLENPAASNAALLAFNESGERADPAAMASLVSLCPVEAR